jgi:hypothetical protein
MTSKGSATRSLTRGVSCDGKNGLMHDRVLKGRYFVKSCPRRSRKVQTAGVAPVVSIVCHVPKIKGVIDTRTRSNCSNRRRQSKVAPYVCACPENGPGAARPPPFGVVDTPARRFHNRWHDRPSIGPYPGRRCSPPVSCNKTTASGLLCHSKRSSRTPPSILSTPLALASLERNAHEQ